MMGRWRLLLMRGYECRAGGKRDVQKRFWVFEEGEWMDAYEKSNKIVEVVSNEMGRIWACGMWMLSEGW